MEEQEYSSNSWHQSKIRWFALMLVCFFDFGNQYCYDFPAVLQKQIMRNFNISALQQNLLYSAFSLPNIILPLVGGFIIDIIGVRIGLISFYSLNVLGHGLCLLGVAINKYILLIYGRILFGFGAEICLVTSAAIVSKWFKGKEISLALGQCLYNLLKRMSVTSTITGTILNGILTPIFYDIYNSLFLPIFVGILFLIFSWISGVILAIIDKQSDERDSDKTENPSENIEKFTFSEIKEFKSDFWLVIISCMLGYINLLVFQQNNISMFQKLQSIIYFFNISFSISKIAAITMYNVPYYIGVVFIPFIGFFIDKVGKRPFILIISGILVCSVDCWYLIIPTTDKPNYFFPFIGQMILGVFYILFASVIWSCVPMTVPEKAVGTAFGLANSLQNFGLAIGPMIAGQLIKNQNKLGYRQMMVFLLLIGIILLMTNIILYFYDSKFNQKKLGKQKIGKSSSINPIIELE